MVVTTDPGGQRFALANRTDGSSYEAPTRWVADQPITLRPRIHAVQRSRADKLWPEAHWVALGQCLQDEGYSVALPHVQIYNFDAAWRTGPQSDSGQVAHQRSIFAQPHPAVDAVWQTWQQVMQGRA